MKKNYVPEIIIEPPLEDTDAAGRHPDEHFCENCPEYVLWEQHKAKKHDYTLDNSLFPVKF